ncbi:MAG: MtnX-like HAD-IB family phosphatase [Terriglobia bacterium]
MKSRIKTASGTPAAIRPVVFSDFDGTITKLDVTDQILSQLAHPSWLEIEQEWACGSIGSRECLERQVALVDASAEDLNALIDSIPVDPRFKGFLRLAERHKLPFYVVSDGFDYVVRRVLKRAGVNGQLKNGTHLFATGLQIEGRRLQLSFPHSATPCEHGCATCKVEIIRRLSIGHSPVVFIGDGLSDRFAVEAADLVFAKHQLLAYCRDRDIECIPFETFADVQVSLKRLLATGEAD